MTTNNTEQLTPQALHQQFSALNRTVIDTVQACTAAQWQATTVAEGWPVGVTARHIAVAHYPVIEWVRMIVEGQPLPPVTMDNVNQLNAQHAQSHTQCTQNEVAELLITNGSNVTSYLGSLTAANLSVKGYLKLFDSEISAEQLFVAVLLQGVAAHLESITATVR